MCLSDLSGPGRVIERTFGRKQRRFKRKVFLKWLKNHQITRFLLKNPFSEQFFSSGSLYKSFFEFIGNLRPH